MNRERSQARELALQCLYQLDLRAEEARDSVEALLADVSHVILHIEPDCRKHLVIAASSGVYFLPGTAELFDKVVLYDGMTILVCR